jgi:enoyl-CoA hydratase/carnithine racemase
MIMATDSRVYTLQLCGTGVFNEDTMAAFNAALDHVEATPDIDLLLITGEDKNFSQGLDLEFLMANVDIFPDFVVRTMHMVGRMLSIGVPVVSVVNGHAFGLGAMLVLGSDYAVMRQDRGFWCLPEVDINMTFSTRMNALVTAKLSPKAARDTMLTGARVPAQQALDMGIVDAVGDVDALQDLALKVAEPMRGKDRGKLAGIKHGINRDLLELFYSDVDDGPYGPYLRPA